MANGKSSLNDDHKEFVDRRIREWDRRREVNLAEKLAAIEKYFNMLVSTRSEAMSIAISRIQGDSKDCLKRCNLQVSTFYDLIHGLKEKDIKQDIVIDSISKTLIEMDEETEKYDLSGKADDKKLEDRIAQLEKWSGSFWTINIPAIVTLAVAVTISILAGWAWVLEYIKKLHGG